jgi:hypothetical protein
MDNRTYVRFVKPCKGFAYVPGQEDWVRSEKIAPFLANGFALAVEPPLPRSIEYRTAAMHAETPQRGRPKKQA